MNFLYRSAESNRGIGTGEPMEEGDEMKGTKRKVAKRKWKEKRKEKRKRKRTR